jgi:hypothetical protein
VTDLQLGVSGGSLVLTWTDLPDAVDYEVFVDTVPYGSFPTTIGVVSSGSTGLAIPIPVGNGYYAAVGRNPASTNQTPLANAGPDRTVAVGLAMRMNGSGSSDTEGHPLSFQWTLVSQPAGSAAVLVDPTLPIPRLTPDVPGLYELTLVVSDGALVSTSDAVTITALNVGAVQIAPSIVHMGFSEVETLNAVLGEPAGPGGALVHLASDDESIVSIPATVLVPQGAFHVDFLAIAGSTAGTATITATAIGHQPGTAEVDVSQFGLAISLQQDLVVAPLETRDLALDLSGAAPYGGITIQVTSSAPALAQVSPSAYVTEDHQIPLANPQVTGAAYGMVTITAWADGVTPDTATVFIGRSLSFAPGSLGVAMNGSGTITLMLSAPAPAGGLTYYLTTDNPGVATVPATIVVPETHLSADVTVHGVAIGSTTLHAAPADPQDTSHADASILVGPGQSINVPDVYVGKDLQAAVAGSLAAPAPAGNLSVTVSSGDPSKVLLTTDPGAPGSSSVMVSVPAGSTVMPVFYVQALAASGAVALTATAPGLDDGTSTVWLSPSGFVLGTGSFTTGQSAPNVALGVASVRLDTFTLDPAQYQAVRAGAAADVAVTSSNPAVGTITVSPVHFAGGAGGAWTAFDPASAGTSTIAIDTPAGFSTPSALQQITVNVTAGIDLAGDGATVGKNLQVPLSGQLGSPAPAGNIQVRIQSSDPVRALVSASPTAQGAGSVTLLVPAGTSTIPTFYVQALDGSGQVQLTASAAGYSADSVTLTLAPSGFVLETRDFGAAPHESLDSAIKV